MAYENILVEKVEGGVGVVTLNRPAKLNALSYALASELDEVVTVFEEDDDIRCVVITGAGEKAFSAGADIHEMAGISADELAERQQRRAIFTWHLATLKKPTIGAINGLAYGGAASSQARSTSASAASAPASGSWQPRTAGSTRRGRLPMVVGWARAKELLYTARDRHGRGSAPDRPAQQDRAVRPVAGRRHRDGPPDRRQHPRDGAGHQAHPDRGCRAGLAGDVRGREERPQHDLKPSPIARRVQRLPQPQGARPGVRAVPDTEPLPGAQERGEFWAF